MLKKLIKFRPVYVLALFLLFAFYFLPTTNAQTEEGISVTPSIMHLDLSQDPPQYSLTYQNNTRNQITLNFSAKDFSQLEDNYRLNFLNEKESENYRYSLSSWISFESKSISLGPGESKSVQIFIDKNRITKGGHYASILAEIVQPESKGKINLKAVLSSLLFVRASTGAEIEEGKINVFSPERNGVEYPKKYLLRFQNSGNVHTIPYGYVDVYDPLGNLAAKGILNENSLDALPESIRNYSIDVKTYQTVLIPGYYTAKLYLHFGKTNQKLDKEIKFFSQGGVNFINLGLIILGTIIVLIYLKKRIKLNLFRKKNSSSGSLNNS